MLFSTLLLWAGLYCFVAVWLALYQSLSTFIKRNPSLADRVANKPGLLSIEFKTINLPAMPQHVKTHFQTAVRWWFNVGVVAACCLSLAFSLFLVWNLWSSLAVGSSLSAVSHSAASRIAPLIPGVNMPLADVGMFLLAIGIAAAYHEFGHALAAYGERVPVLGYGFGVLGFVVPSAFVRLCDTLHHQSLAAQMRVYCGGVWHNLVLAGVALLIGTTATSVMCAPFYTTGSGVLVASVPFASPLYGHVVPGDVVTSLNHLPVASSAEWLSRLQFSAHHNIALCVNASVFDSLSSHDVDCCSAVVSSPSNISSSSAPGRMCFAACEILARAHVSGAGAGVSRSYTCAGTRRARRVCALPRAVVHASTGSCGVTVAPGTQTFTSFDWMRAPSSVQLARADAKVNEWGGERRDPGALSHCLLPLTLQVSESATSQPPGGTGTDARASVPQSWTGVHHLGLANGSVIGYMGTPADVASLFVPSAFVPRPFVAALLPTQYAHADYDAQAQELLVEVSWRCLTRFFTQLWSHCRLLVCWALLSSPLHVASLFRFVALLSLSMAACNSLPLPHSDGHAAAGACVARALTWRRRRGRRESEEEDGEEGTVEWSEERHSSQLACSVAVVMRYLVRGTVVLAATNALLAFASFVL